MKKFTTSRLMYFVAVLTAVSVLIASRPSACAQGSPAVSNQAGPVQVRALKVTVLSTMLVGETAGIGEWGFSALVEAKGNRILVDTGFHPDTVLQNAGDLKLD